MTSGYYGFGVTQAGEGHVVTVASNTPRNNTRPGILALHGALDDATQMSTRDIAQQGAHIKALAEAGFIVAGVDAGGPGGWSSDAAMTAISSGYTWLVGAGGAKPSKIALFGWSMGGGNSLNWIKRNPAKVAGAWLWTPATDLDFFHGTAGYTPAYSPGSVAAGGFAADVNTAYGGTSNYTTKSIGHRIRDEYASWRGLGIPIKVAHALDDNIIPVAQNRDGFVPGVNDPNVTFRSIATGSHTQLFSQVPTSEVLAFYRALSY